MGKGIQKTKVTVEPSVHGLSQAHSEPRRGWGIEVVDLSSRPSWVALDRDASAATSSLHGAQQGTVEALRERPAQAELALELPPPSAVDERAGQDDRRSSSEAQSFYVFGDDNDEDVDRGVAVVDFFI